MWCENGLVPVQGRYKSTNYSNDVSKTVGYSALIIITNTVGAMHALR